MPIILHLRVPNFVLIVVQRVLNRVHHVRGKAMVNLITLSGNFLVHGGGISELISTLRRTVNRVDRDTIKCTSHATYRNFQHITNSRIKLNKRIVR